MFFSVGDRTEPVWINVALDVQHLRLQPHPHSALVRVEEVLGFSQVLLNQLLEFLSGAVSSLKNQVTENCFFYFIFIDICFADISKQNIVAYQEGIQQNVVCETKKIAQMTRSRIAESQERRNCNIWKYFLILIHLVSLCFVTLFNSYQLSYFKTENRKSKYCN